MLWEDHAISIATIHHFATPERRLESVRVRPPSFSLLPSVTHSPFDPDSNSSSLSSLLFPRPPPHPPANPQSSSSSGLWSKTPPSAESVPLDAGRRELSPFPAKQKWIQTNKMSLFPGNSRRQKRRRFGRLLRPKSLDRLSILALLLLPSTPHLRLRLPQQKRPRSRRSTGITTSFGTTSSPTSSPPLRSTSARRSSLLRLPPFPPSKSSPSPPPGLPTPPTPI